MKLRILTPEKLWNHIKSEAEKAPKLDPGDGRIVVFASTKLKVNNSHRI